jgi:hypothetical protein
MQLMKAVVVLVRPLPEAKQKKRLRDFSDNFFATALAQCTHTPHIVHMYAEGMNIAQHALAHLRVSGPWTN